MTVEKARKVSKALEDFEMFIMFIDEIDGVLNDYADQCDLSKFEPKLKLFLEEELERRRSILEGID